MDLTIKTKDGKVLKVDSFMNYGNEKDYLAKVGEEVYVKCPSGYYELLNASGNCKDDTK